MKIPSILEKPVMTMASVKLEQLLKSKTGITANIDIKNVSIDSDGNLTVTADINANLNELIRFYTTKK